MMGQAQVTRSSTPMTDKKDLFISINRILDERGYSGEASGWLHSARERLLEAALSEQPGPRSYNLRDAANMAREAAFVEGKYGQKKNRAGNILLASATLYDEAGYPEEAKDARETGLRYLSREQ